MRIAAYAFTVLLLVSQAAPLRGDTLWRIDDAEVLIDIPLTPAGFLDPDAALVFDASSAYVAASDGLYKLDRALTPQSLERIAFPGESVRNAYVHDGALYVLKMTAENRGPALDHGFFRSNDGGQTLVPLDTKLEDCNGEWCRFMTAGEALFAGDCIFLTAGGNVIVTDDDGASWHALRGSLQSQACYEPAMYLDGARLFVGGECPLDSAFLEAGVLDESGIAWKSLPAPLETPWLENRKIQFITRAVPGPRTSSSEQKEGC
ncbi:MAG: beta propeller repeat protein [Thermoanaerobaculia bacterium]